MKHCTKCNQDKQDSEFYVQKRKNKPARLSGYCRPCMRLYYLTPRKKQKSLEKTLAKQEATRAAWRDLSGETWVDVAGYEGLYEVSNFSRVRSHHNGVNLMAFPINSKLGYRYGHLCKDGEAKMFYLHRIVAKAFIANPNNYPDVNHLDGDKANNAISNLEWCTPQMNTHHSIHVLKNHPAYTQRKANK